MSTDGLTIREVTSRTGVEVATLRMWEQRHGFPDARAAAQAATAATRTWTWS